VVLQRLCLRILGPLPHPVILSPNALDTAGPRRTLVVFILVPIIVFSFFSGAEAGCRPCPLIRNSRLQSFREETIIQQWWLKELCVAKLGLKQIRTCLACVCDEMMSTSVFFQLVVELLCSALICQFEEKIKVVNFRQGQKESVPTDCKCVEY
jgi:hypothetical protein